MRIDVCSNRELPLTDEASDFGPSTSLPVQQANASVAQVMRENTGTTDARQALAIAVRSLSAVTLGNNGASESLSSPGGSLASIASQRGPGSRALGAGKWTQALGPEKLVERGRVCVDRTE